MDKLERIRQRRDDYESAMDEAERLRDEYHREIVKLHRSGMSLREIAEGLGMSHQRVHQIVSPHEERASGRKVRRGAAGAAGLVVILLLLAGVVLPRSGEVPPPRAVPTPAPQSRSAASPDCITRATDRSPLRFIAEANRCARSGVVILDPQTGRILASVVDSKVRATVDEQLQQDLQEYLNQLVRH